MSESQENIHELLRQLSNSQKADLFLFSHDISEGTADEIIQIVKAQEEKKENAILFLTTNGGDPDAAFRIARYFKRTYEKFYVYVFGYCKSAGTLIVLGANSIVMSDFGELGPLDLQIYKDDDIQRGSVLDIQQALDVIGAKGIEFFGYYIEEIVATGYEVITTRAAIDIASTIAVGLLSPISSPINPLKLGEMNRLAKVAAEYGERLSLEEPDLVEAIASLIHDYPSHSFVIDFEEATIIFGERVKYANDLELLLENFLLLDVRESVG
ncbi:MAG: ATP-dependent Clp protease proteolytic subunit [Cyanobacteria bacterium P01_G01_bin.54]